MQNRNTEQQLKIAESKLQRKKQQFIDIQGMDLNSLRQYIHTPSQINNQLDDDTYQDIQKYQQMRQNSKIIITQNIQPSNYKPSMLTPQDCRKYHQRLRQKKILYADRMKHIDQNDLKDKYWKQYKQFVVRFCQNNQNVSNIAKGIAEVKNYIQILNKPMNYQQMELCSKQPLQEDTITDLNHKYNILQRTIKDKQLNLDLDIESIMNRAKKYFGQIETIKNQDTILK